MKRLFPLILFLISLDLNPTLADTITVSGTVSGTWSADTVLVVGEVRIPTDSTLTIEPGVKVIFRGHYKLIVDTLATLLAVGTEQDSILFTAANPDTGWYGIRFWISSDSSQLEYCHITQGIAAGNEEDRCGGGIYCYYASPTVAFCLIDHCTAELGGGIALEGASNPLIKNNIIRENTASTISYNSGGGIYCMYPAGPIITNNLICGNFAEDDGGGIYSNTGDPPITNNIIYNNSAYSASGIYVRFHESTISSNVICGNNSEFCGGGIFLDQSNMLVEGNIIAENLASHGAGICVYILDPTIINNDIVGNIGYWYGSCVSTGGGIYFSDYSDPFIGYNNISGNMAYSGGALRGEYYCNPIIKNNTLCGNISENGGGFSCEDDVNAIIENCIFWGNIPSVFTQGSGTVLEVTYSDIQGSWTGIGNINVYPEFLNPERQDFRLLWDSPCIDSGNPDSTCNDPDGTRSDMGASYYNQNVPVSVFLTQHDFLPKIPMQGSCFDFTIQAVNIDSIAHQVEFLCNITLPDSSVYGPVIGPLTLTLESGCMIDRVRTQTIPAGAPWGIYHYNAYAIVDADTSKDSFVFIKLDANGHDASAGWHNWGEPFHGVESGLNRIASADKSLSIRNYPNPFNLTTTLRYFLPNKGRINLSVYDVTGRLVMTIINGWREAGDHEMTFDATDLSSGVYFYRLSTGGYIKTGKMLLLK